MSARGGWPNALLFVSLLAACPALPAQAIQRYAYAADRIYAVHAGLGITTEIELAADDDIQDYSTGFSSGWELGRRGNVIYLKPRNVDVDTNLLVRTAARSYIFELMVVTTDWKTLDEARRAGVSYRIAFTYPNADTGQGPPQPAASLGASAALVAGRSYNFNYDFAARGTDASWLVPASVYDDGRFTYIRLRDTPQLPSGDFPAIFMREREQGEDALVNTSIDGRTIVVHGTYPYLVVRHGKQLVGLRRNTPP